MLKFYSKPRKKREYPESRLQKAIVQHLFLNNAFFWSTPNEGVRSAAACARFKALGMYPGASDLVIIVDGKAHCLEVKAPGGVQSASQRTFQQDCRNNGVPYEIVFNLPEALKVLSDWRAIRPVKAAA